MYPGTDVALVLWNVDVIDLVASLLRERRLSVVGLEPREETERIQEVLTARGPRVVVFDLAPPYRRSGQVAADLLRSFKSSKFIFTCADPKVAFMMEPWLSCYQVFQKPYDVMDLTDVIASTLKPSVAPFAACAGPCAEAIRV